MSGSRTTACHGVNFLPNQGQNVGCKLLEDSKYAEKITKKIKISDVDPDH